MRCAAEGGIAFYQIPWHNVIMRTKVTIDKAGRLVLPKPLRDELRLAPGDILDLMRDGDKIIISPARPQSTLQKEHGVWVYRSGQPTEASLPEIINQDREDRIRELLG